MNKIALLMMVLSFNVVAGDETNSNSYLNNNCASLSDPDEKKGCLDIEKRNEAEQNFRNFEQDNQVPYQQNF